MDGKEISLSEALSTSIKTIIENYNSKWAVIGDVSGKILDMPGQYDFGEKLLPEEWRDQKHIYPEICICLEGSLAMLFGEHIVNLEKGDVCFILPGVLHSEMPKKKNSYIAIWASFGMNMISMHLSGKNNTTGQFYTLTGCSLKADSDLSFYTDLIKKETTGPQTFSNDVIKLNILHLLIMIYRSIQNNTGTEPEGMQWKESIVLKTKEYIERNCSRAIRLSDISQEICISPNYLNSIFKSITGNTIIRYAEEHKIKKAKEMLKNSSLSIGTIALALGYYDQYHFSRSFKKETGYSPTQYREL